MELRYCETCGKVLTLTGESEEINPAEHFTCSHCKALRAKAGVKRPETKVGKKGQGTLDFLSSPLEEGKLDLFSGATLVRYKEKRKRRGSGLLGLRGEEPLGPEALDLGTSGSSTPAKSAKKIQFHCMRCKSVLQIRPVNATSRMVCPQCKLVLFVDETGRISKTPPGAAKPPAQGAPATAQASGSPMQRKGLRTSAHPEPVKLKFHCLHCRVALGVRAVKEPSRMICPKCKGNLFIDPSGLVSKVPPRIPRAVKPSVQPTAPAKERVAAPPPAMPTIPPGIGAEKESSRPPKPKRARKKKRKARAKTPVEPLVRVSTFLPADVVDVIEETGQAKSKVIREIIEQKIQKVRPPALPEGPPEES